MGDDERTGIRIETAKFDARFPNQNQTKNCWQNFVDYQKCIKRKGEDYEPCQFFKKTYRSLCPIAWVGWIIFTLIAQVALIVWYIGQTIPPTLHILIPLEP